MIKLISEKITRIIKNKKNLEKDLNVKIKNRGKEIYLSGEPEDEYIAEKIIEALEFGFPFSTAMLIKKEDFDFMAINIKSCANQKNLERVRGRIIGKNGKTLKTLSNLSNCSFEIKNNQIGIIGDPDCIKNAEEACKLLLKGSKHANVYSYLEKHHPEPIFDLGLKEPKKR
ncbi:MAG TPA: KH domain-containing protein [Candidatus Pacearchaeota archaeon]|nr:KH domain-containing protein [Candidatus Pacearchaeota archaeon]